MNSNYTEFKFPQIKACQWRKVFRSKTPEDAMDFIGSTLAYDPERRIKPLEGCGHAFFDELRDERTRLPNGNVLPPVFDFTHHELASSPELLAKVSFHVFFFALKIPSTWYIWSSYLAWILDTFLQLIPPHVNIDGINAGDSKPQATR